MEVIINAALATITVLGVIFLAFPFFAAFMDSASGNNSPWHIMVETATDRAHPLWLRIYAGYYPMVALCIGVIYMVWKAVATLL
jgi:hypothetical protein